MGSAPSPLTPMLDYVAVSPPRLTVPVTLLLPKMKAHKAPDQVMALADGLSFHVRRARWLSMAVRLSPSIRVVVSSKGSLLSPLLIDIFIDDLARLLN